MLCVVDDPDGVGGGAADAGQADALLLDLLVGEDLLHVHVDVALGDDGGAVGAGAGAAREGPVVPLGLGGLEDVLALGDVEGAVVLVVVGIGCLMAFSSGTSNIANAIAPLVGSGDLDINVGIVIGSVAVGAGALTIGRRTLDTLGSGLTSLPLTASIIVATVSATIVVLLSAIGIPASFVIIATMSIIGLGWGRATRTTTVSGLGGEDEPAVSVGSLAGDEGGEELPAIGEEEPEDIPATTELFDPSTTVRVVVLQNVVPIIATVGAYATFQFIPVFGF